MKKVFIVITLIILILSVVIAATGTKLSWNTRDEWQGVVVQTCRYYGLWNPKYGIRFVASKNCMSI